MAQFGIMDPGRWGTTKIVIAVKNISHTLLFFCLFPFKHVLNICSCKPRGVAVRFHLIFKPLVNSIHSMSIYSMELYT